MAYYAYSGANFGDLFSKLHRDRHAMVPHYSPNPATAALQRDLEYRKSKGPLGPQSGRYPMMAEQGDVPVILVGAPKTAEVYQPVPVRKTDNSPGTTRQTHLAESPAFTTQGEPRDAVYHPFHWSNLGYTITHHPVDFVRQLFDYAKQGVGWIWWNYEDFYEQFRNWDGSWVGLAHSTGLFWRGLVCALITVGLWEIAPLLEALASWLRLTFDFLKGALQLTGVILDDVWYLLQRVWDDVTGLFASS